MDPRLFVVGLGASFVGAVVAAVADAWLSRSMLMYLDAIEANVARLVDAVRSGGALVKTTGFDLRRDAGQNRARMAKTAGWLLLAAGMAVQLAAAFLGR
jgi:hypothetical protein